MGRVTQTIYSVEEANRVLPFVRSVVRDIVDEFRLLRGAGRERRALEVESGGTTDVGRRLEALKDQVSEYSVRIEGYLQELSDFGLEVRDLELGLVDFPALICGEPAYLSWRLGEEAVSWWHPADKGFNDRTRVPEEVAALPAPQTAASSDS